MHKQFEDLLSHHADVGDDRLLNWDYGPVSQNDIFADFLSHYMTLLFSVIKSSIYILYMTHLRSAGSQHSQQLVDFALFESYATYFNIGRTCFTAYSVLGKPMTFLIICILAKSRKPQIFSLRLFKSPIQKPQESCRKIRNTEIYSAGKIKSTSADNSGSAFFSLVEISGIEPLTS